MINNSRDQKEKLSQITVCSSNDGGEEVSKTERLSSRQGTTPDVFSGGGDANNNDDQNTIDEMIENALKNGQNVLASQFIHLCSNEKIKFYLACAEGDDQSIVEFMAGGIKPDAMVFRLCCSNGHLDLINELFELKQCDIRTGALYACFGGAVEVLKFFCQKCHMQIFNLLFLQTCLGACEQLTYHDMTRRCEIWIFLVDKGARIFKHLKPHMIKQLLDRKMEWTDQPINTSTYQEHWRYLFDKTCELRKRRRFKQQVVVHALYDYARLNKLAIDVVIISFISHL